MRRLMMDKSRDDAIGSVLLAEQGVLDLLIAIVIVLLVAMLVF